MRFDVLEISLEVVHRLRRPLARVRQSDPKLFDQIRRAASSVPLNIAGGSRRHGRDRLQLYPPLAFRGLPALPTSSVLPYGSPSPGASSITQPSPSRSRCSTACSPCSGTSASDGWHVRRGRCGAPPLPAPPARKPGRGKGPQSQRAPVSEWRRGPKGR
ncbi:MAG: four helix bundle protein [Planctomycetota bacterium]